MIKINLLGEAEQGPKEGLYWLLAYAASFVLCLSGFFYYGTSVSAQLEAAESEVESYETQLSQLQTKTAEVANLERKQNELNAKIALVAKLKKSRTGPVRVLDDLNEAIPELAWLSEVVEQNEKMKLQGYSLDNQTVTKFIRTLDKSPYFKEVNLIQASQAMREKVKISSFNIAAEISYAGEIAPTEAP